MSLIKNQTFTDEPTGRFVPNCNYNSSLRDVMSGTFFQKLGGSVRSCLYKNTDLHKMDALLTEIIDPVIHIERTSYVQRLLLVLFVVIGALLLNAVIGRLLERLRKFVERRLCPQFVDIQEELQATFAMDIAFDFANLTCTALLVWEVDHVTRWMLQMETPG